MNFLNKKIFNYKAGVAESIDDILSELSRLQIIIQGIKETEAPIDLDVAFTLINLVDNKVYVMARYHLKNKRKLTLANTKEGLKLVEQKIQDVINPKEDTANKAFSKSQSGSFCFHCEKPAHFKAKCFKWLATNEGKKYTKNHSDDDKDGNAKQASDNKNKPKNSQNRSRSKKLPGKRSENAHAAQKDSEDDSDIF